MRATVCAVVVGCLLAAGCAAAAEQSAGKVEAVVAALHAAVGNPDLHAPMMRMTGEPAPASDDWRPCVLMHGLGDAGSNPGMQSLAQSVSDKYPGMYAVAVNVANGLASFLEPMQKQVDEFAETVKSDPKLAKGFNAVGLSQGGIIPRAYIQQYGGKPGYPPMYNFVSICGVQNGVWDCPAEVRIIPFLCDWYKSNPYHFLFNGSIPLSFADYFVTTRSRNYYVDNNPWLPDINNQKATKNPTYKANLMSLNKLVLIQATEDEVVYPYQSEQFGGYAWGSDNVVFNYTQNPAFQGDWLGMKTMYNRGDIEFGEFVGGHIRFNESYWNDYVLPLVGNKF